MAREIVPSRARQKTRFDAVALALEIRDLPDGDGPGLWHLAHVYALLLSILRARKKGLSNAKNAKQDDDGYRGKRSARCDGQGAMRQRMSEVYAGEPTFSYSCWSLALTRSSMWREQDVCGKSAAFLACVVGAG